MAQITIGSEFFGKAKNDYNDWRFALVREFMQNCIDCDSDNIIAEVLYNEELGQTCVTVYNDGEPMTEDILVNNLLALGSSGKDRSNGCTTIGGFGKAKEILYFCHQSYMIETADMMVCGSGAQYTLENDMPYLEGTRSTITIEGDVQFEIVKQFQAFAALCQWRGNLVVNGKPFQCGLRKGYRRKELSFGTIYTNKQFENCLVVRINGVPMYSDWISYDHTVVIELTHDSLDCLTSNRDGLKGEYRTDLNGFIQELAADKGSALKDMSPKYTVYEGTPFTISIDSPEEKNVAAFTAVSEEPGTEPLFDPVLSGELVAAPAAPQRDVTGPVERISSVVDFNFIVKDEIRTRQLPRHCLPEKMSTMNIRLLKQWSSVLVQLHELLGMETTFSVGFVFSEECEAQYEEGDHGKVYYLNPCRMDGKKFLKRYNNKPADHNRLLAIALHEVVHGLGYGWHDENYACALTEKMAVVMDNRSKFNHCFKVKATLRK